MTDLHLLQTFVTFAQARNISEAARTLRCSQSTVQLHLQRLEEEMAFPIFRSQGKKKVLTEQGRTLLDSLAPRLAALTDALRSTGGTLARVKNQRLRIGGRREIVSRLALTLRFEGTLEFSFCSEDEARSKFLSHELDLMVTHSPQTFSPQVLIRRLFASGSVLLVHRKWLTRTKMPKFSLSPEFLRGVPALKYGANDARLQAICARLAIDPRDIQTRVCAEDWQLLLELVQQGAGYCIGPDTQIQPSRELATLNVPDSIIPRRTFYLAYRKPVQELLRAKKLVLENGA